MDNETIQEQATKFGWFATLLMRLMKISDLEDEKERERVSQLVENEFYQSPDYLNLKEAENMLTQENFSFELYDIQKPFEQSIRVTINNEVYSIIFSKYCFPFKDVFCEIYCPNGEIDRFGSLTEMIEYLNKFR